MRGHMGPACASVANVPFSPRSIVHLPSEMFVCMNIDYVFPDNQHVRQVIAPYLSSNTCASIFCRKTQLLRKGCANLVQFLVHTWPDLEHLIIYFLYTLAAKIASKMTPRLINMPRRPPPLYLERPK